MPFGLTNALATFQRLMDAVLAGLRWQKCLVYLDDIIVFGKDFDTHLQRLDEVFQRLRENNLVLKPKKCDLLRTTVEYLGHVVSKDGITPQKDKIVKVQKFPIPTTRKAVRAFLGLAGYYHKFIKDFARIAPPLHLLTAEKQKWQWTNIEQASFDKLKEALTTAPMLRFPHPTWPITLDTDASKEGYGAILMQTAPDGKEHVLAYASKVTLPNEKNWSTTELEAGAIVWVLEKFRPYLIDVKFRCRTDHANLKWIRDSSKGRLIRWALKLDEYDMVLEPQAGIKMAYVDALSRYLVTMILPDEFYLVLITEEFIGETIAPKNTEKTSVMRWAQRQDGKCQNIYKALKYGTKVYAHLTKYINAQQFVIDDRIIMFKDDHKQVPFVPATLRQRLLYEYHCGTCSAHLGSKKVLGALKKKYFWPAMHNDVYEYVRGCLDCLQRKGKPMKQGKTIPLPKGTPFQFVASDIFGPLPITQRQNRFVLVFIDHFTKWPVIIPAPHITAESFVRYFHDNWITQFGCPSRLLTDGGPQFIADVTKEFCEKYNTNKTIVTAYHPQSNGIAEAFMKVLGNSLAILTKCKATNWDLYCNTIALAYRTAIHPGINNTPVYLTFGFDPKLPVDCDIMENDKQTDTDERLQQLAIWRKFARSRLRVEPDYETINSDTRIQPGMLVAYKLNIQKAREPVIHKLLPRFSSPWRVIRQFDNSVTYEIRHPERGETKLINRDRLVIYTPNEGSYNLYDAPSAPRLFPSKSSTTMQTPLETARTITETMSEVTPTALPS